MNSASVIRIDHMQDDATLILRWRVHLRAKKLTDRTIRIRTYYVERLAKRTPLRDATIDDLEHILASSDYAPETLKSIRASWRGFYSWAHRQGHLPANPADELAPIRVPASVPHLAPDNAITTAAAKAEPQTRAMLLLARLACLRLNEIATLHTDCRNGDWLTVIGKGGKERRLYLHPDVRQALQTLEHTQGSGYYFPGRWTGHLHRETVYRWIRDACGHNPHSLRHAGATAAYRSTRDLRAVQEMLGHSSMAVTQRYLHLDDDSLRAVGLATALAA